MPYDVSPSPVAPQAGSRLWTAGASAGVSIIVLVGLAVLYPALLWPLLTGAAIVAAATWAVNRRPGGSSKPLDPAETASDSPTADPVLLELLFEALADPVLVVAGTEADDISDRRILLANGAARERLRITREGALLVSALRDPGVLEAIDESLFGRVERSTEYAGVGAQTRHWRAFTRPLDSDGAPSLALVVLRDETDVRRMELMRVDFLANASH